MEEKPEEKQGEKGTTMRETPAGNGAETAPGAQSEAPTVALESVMVVGGLILLVTFLVFCFFAEKKIRKRQIENARTERAAAYQQASSTRKKKAGAGQEASTAKTAKVLPYPSKRRSPGNATGGIGYSLTGWQDYVQWIQVYSYGKDFSCLGFVSKTSGGSRSSYGYASYCWDAQSAPKKLAAEAAKREGQSEFSNKVRYLIADSDKVTGTVVDFESVGVTCMFSYDNEPIGCWDSLKLPDTVKAYRDAAIEVHSLM